MKILIIDDDKDVSDPLQYFLQKLGHITIIAINGKDALLTAKKFDPDLVLLDYVLPDLLGHQLLPKLKNHKPDCEVIMVSGHDNIEEMLQTLDVGAYDFMAKPIDLKKIVNTIHEIEAKLSTKDRPDVLQDLSLLAGMGKSIKVNDIIFSEDQFIHIGPSEKFFVHSSQMKHILKKVNKLAEFPQVPLLIEGNTGTGKELIAKYFHYNDPDTSTRPFVSINCATIGKDLFDAEFFGYEKGAFTGALPEGKIGKIKAAEGGILFLDEISEIPPDLQVKLLRVLQEREFYSVGGTTPQSVNARIVCATNRDLKTYVKSGFFREDLYYRLTACQVRIPPLRERLDIILPLVVFFIKELNHKAKHTIEKLEAPAAELLLKYSWPGNIRELKNVVTQFFMLGNLRVIKEKDVKEILPYIDNTQRTYDPSSTPLGKTVKSLSGSDCLLSMEFQLPEDGIDLEKFIHKIVEKTMKRFKGNKTKVAKFLRISRNQLYNRYRT